MRRSVKAEWFGFAVTSSHPRYEAAWWRIWKNEADAHAHAKEIGGTVVPIALIRGEFPSRITTKDDGVKRRRAKRGRAR